MVTSPIAMPSLTPESLTIILCAFVTLVSGMVTTAPDILTTPPLATPPVPTVPLPDTTCACGLPFTRYGVSKGNYHCVVVRSSGASAFNTNVTGQWQIDIASKGSVHLPRDSATRHRRAAAAEASGLR